MTYIHTHIYIHDSEEEKNEAAKEIGELEQGAQEMLKSIFGQLIDARDRDMYKTLPSKVEIHAMGMLIRWVKARKGGREGE